MERPTTSEKSTITRLRVVGRARGLNTNPVPSALAVTRRCWGECVERESSSTPSCKESSAALKQVSVGHSPVMFFEYDHSPSALYLIYACVNVFLTSQYV